MNMRLFLSCAELGLGHSTRIIALGRKLAERRHDLFFFSGGIAYQRLRKEFAQVYPCTPVAWYETSHGILASASLLNILIPLPSFNHEKNKLVIKSPSATETVHRYYDLRRHIKEIRPEMIISDGDMHALRLAHRWKIPAVYITNIIRPSYGFSPLLAPGERFTERYVRECTKIIVPDNPPPHTVCEYNLGDLKKIRVKDKIEFVGPFTDMAPIRGLEKHIFASISGPFGTRAKLTQMIIPVLRQLGTNSVISLGEPSKRSAKKMGNCKIHTWLTTEEREQYMRNSKIVVFSGGHTTCFEIIKYGKPSVCIPTQPEQMANAKKIMELNCSKTVKNKEQLKGALQEIDEKKEFFKTNVKALNEYSINLKGPNQAVSVIENVTKT